MTGNKDENIQGVAGEGSKPVSIMNVKSGTDANILHFIDYDFYDWQTDPVSQMAYFGWEYNFRWALGVVGMCRKRQTCSTSRATSPGTPAARLRKTFSRNSFKVFFSARKVRFPWLHNMVHWALWSRWEFQNSLILTWLLSINQERLPYPLLLRSSWFQGVLLPTALMEITSGVWQLDIEIHYIIERLFDYW